MVRVTILALVGLAAATQSPRKGEGKGDPSAILAKLSQGGPKGTKPDITKILADPKFKEAIAKLKNAQAPGGVKGPRPAGGPKTPRTPKVPKVTPRQAPKQAPSKEQIQALLTKLPKNGKQSGPGGKLDLAKLLSDPKAKEALAKLKSSQGGASGATGPRPKTPRVPKVTRRQAKEAPTKEQIQAILAKLPKGPDGKPDIKKILADPKVKDAIAKAKAAQASKGSKLVTRQAKQTPSKEQIQSLLASLPKGADGKPDITKILADPKFKDAIAKAKAAQGKTGQGKGLAKTPRTSKGTKLTPRQTAAKPDIKDIFAKLQTSKGKGSPGAGKINPKEFLAKLQQGGGKGFPKSKGKGL